MNDRFNMRYFNKNTKEFEYLKIGAVNFNLFTDWTVYEQGQFCTGLKDKNGKLIYEGDIVSDKSNHIRVVVWEQDCFKYPALKTSRYFHRPISNQLEERKIGLRGKLTFQDAIGKCDKKHFEVIGNIYENKELLESEG